MAKKLWGPTLLVHLLPPARPRQCIGDLFEQVNGFDEDFFCYVEDIDLGFRMRHQGAKAWQVGDAVVYHISSAITGKGSEFSIYHGMRNMIWMIAKNIPSPLLPVVLMLNLLAQSCALIFFFRPYKRSILRALRDAIKGFPKMLGKRQHMRLGTWQALALISLNPIDYFKKNNPYLK